jgi:hypothetical protein
MLSEKTMGCHHEVNVYDDSLLGLLGTRKGNSVDRDEARKMINGIEESGHIVECTRDRHRNWNLGIELPYTLLLSLEEFQIQPGLLGTG